MDPIELSIYLYLQHISTLYYDDEIETAIIEYMAHFENNYKPKEKKTNSAPAKAVFDHFLGLYFKKYGMPYLVASNKMGIYIRIANFMRQQNLTVDEYKEFLDLAFKQIFNLNFKPSIGHLDSARIFEMIKNTTAKKPKIDFRKVRNALRR